MGQWEVYRYLFLRVNERERYQPQAASKEGERVPPTTMYNYQGFTTIFMKR